MIQPIAGEVVWDMCIIFLSADAFFRINYIVTLGARNVQAALTSKLL
jgi:hypothetical protein